jgi:hypothetical protein
LQPLHDIANLALVNWEEMTTLNHDTSRLKIEKGFVWLMTIALMVAGLPLLKNTVVSILLKLYELFIQHAIGK